MSFPALVQLRQRLRRRRRRIALGLLILAGAAACAWFVLMEGTLLRTLVAREIGAQLKATCTIKEFRWNGWNRAEIRGLSLRVADWPESASEVMSVAQMRADFDPLPLLWGSLALTDITVDAMTIRAIERADGSELNLMKIVLPESRGSRVRPPRINIQALSLQLGTLHDATGVVEIQAQRDLVGGLFSDRAVRSKWHIELTQKEAGQTDPARLTGWLEGDTFAYAMTLSNLKLDDALRRLFPGPIRQLWKRMDLTGSIDQVTMSGDRDYPVRNARLEVRDLDMTLPDPGFKNAWARYCDGQIQSDSGLPRIHVDRGVVRFDEWHLHLEQLRGSLASSDLDAQVTPMPVELSFNVDLHRGRLRNWTGKDAENWAEAALEHAPFDLRLTVQNFAIKPVDGRPPTLELPIVAAVILYNFQAREGTVSIEANVSREPPIWTRPSQPDAEQPDEGPIASEIRFHGAIAIQGGRGGYFKFPYELKDVQAHITFADDVVDVHYLRGRGSQGAEVTVKGTVLEPGDDAGIDLRITSERAPIDDALVEGLKFSPAQRFLTLLFNQKVNASLKQSGVLSRMVETLRSERELFLKDQMTSARSATASGTANDPAQRTAIAAEVRRFKVLDWLPNFEPSGWCALDLRIQRAIRGGDHVVTTGTITLHEALAISEPLPYPMRVAGRDGAGAAGATITLEDERILLPEKGLQISLAGGGEGIATGYVDLPRGADGKRVVTPHVKITTRGDHLNPLLLAAIPIDDPEGPIRGAHDGWPGTRRSETAEIMSAIGLEGTVAAAIELGGDGKGDITWNAFVDLTEGRAEPKQDQDTDLAGGGLAWPQGFVLEDITAAVAIDEAQARLLEFKGLYGKGRVRGTGEADLNTGARSLRVNFEQVSPGDYLVNLLPHSERERANRFWIEHEPSGLFDADLDWSKDADGHQRRTLRVQPEWISFRTVAPEGDPAIPAGIVTITREAGDFNIVDRTIEARGLTMRIDEPGDHRSSLLLDGFTGARLKADAMALGASWTGARFESPLLVEALSLAGADEAVQLWRSHRPEGRFSALISTVASTDDASATWRVRLRMEELRATFDGVATAMVVDPASEPITIESSLITVPSFAATTENGRLELDGEIPLDRTIASGKRLRVRFDGARFGAPELAFLGTRARKALAAIEFTCDGPTRLHDGELLFGLSDTPYLARFAGVVELSSASFRTGVLFKDLAGMVRVDIDPASRSLIEVDASRFLIADHPVRDARAVIIVASDGSRIEIPKLSGLLAGGSANAGVVVDFDKARPGGGDYQVWANLVGAQLSELPAQTRVEVEASAAPASAGPRAMGRVDGELRIAGVLDDPARRVGRGRFEIRDGRMADLPITMSLLQVSQLMLPLNTALDSGDIRFHISGEQLVFDRFELTSPTLRFQGKGDLNLRENELALRFRNRGTLPLWSDLFGVVSDTLFAIDVRGPLGDPAVSVAPLPPFNRAPSEGREETRP